MAITGADTDTTDAATTAPTDTTVTTVTGVLIITGINQNPGAADDLSRWSLGESGWLPPQRLNRSILF